MLSVVMTHVVRSVPCALGMGGFPPDLHVFFNSGSSILLMF